MLPAKNNNRIDPIPDYGLSTGLTGKERPIKPSAADLPRFLLIRAEQAAERHDGGRRQRRGQGKPENAEQGAEHELKPMARYSPSKNSFTRAKKPVESGLVLSLEAFSNSFSRSRCLRVRLFGVSTSTWM